MLIRGYLNERFTHLQVVQKKYASFEQPKDTWTGMRCRLDFDKAMIAHHDGMNKVYLPYFCVKASSHITRLQYAFTGHVNNFSKK